MATTTIHASRRAEPTSEKHTTLDALARLSSDELELLYRASGVGRGVATLVGRPKGRMLAIRGTDGTPLFAWVQRLAARAFFPWDGKTFGALGSEEGRGDNRVKAIVTTLDLRIRLGIAPRPEGSASVSVVVRAADGGPVSLVVDQIGDVIEADETALEAPPDTVPAELRELVAGVYKLPHCLMLLLDTDRAVTVSEVAA